MTLLQAIANCGPSRRRELMRRYWARTIGAYGGRRALPPTRYALNPLILSGWVLEGRWCYANPSWDQAYRWHSQTVDRRDWYLHHGPPGWSSFVQLGDRWDLQPGECESCPSG